MKIMDNRKLFEKVKIHPEVIFELNSEKKVDIFSSFGKGATIHTMSWSMMKQVAVFRAFPNMLEYWKS